MPARRSKGNWRTSRLGPGGRAAVTCLQEPAAAEADRALWMPPLRGARRAALRTREESPDEQDGETTARVHHSSRARPTAATSRGRQPGDPSLELPAEGPRDGEPRHGDRGPDRARAAPREEGRGSSFSGKDWGEPLALLRALPLRSPLRLRPARTRTEARSNSRWRRAPARIVSVWIRRRAIVVATRVRRPYSARRSSPASVRRKPCRRTSDQTMEISRGRTRRKAHQGRGS